MNPKEVSYSDSYFLLTYILYAVDGAARMYNNNTTCLGGMDGHMHWEYSIVVVYHVERDIVSESDHPKDLHSLFKKREDYPEGIFTKHFIS